MSTSTCALIFSHLLSISICILILSNTSSSSGAVVAMETTSTCGGEQEIKTAVLLSMGTGPPDKVSLSILIRSISHTSPHSTFPMSLSIILIAFRPPNDIDAWEHAWLDLKNQLASLYPRIDTFFYQAPPRNLTGIAPDLSIIRLYGVISYLQQHAHQHQLIMVTDLSSVWQCDPFHRYVSRLQQHRSDMKMKRVPADPFQLIPEGISIPADVYLPACTHVTDLHTSCTWYRSPLVLTFQNETLGAWRWRWQWKQMGLDQDIGNQIQYQDCSSPAMIMGGTYTVWRYAQDMIKIGSSCCDPAVAVYGMVRGVHNILLHTHHHMLRHQIIRSDEDDAIAYHCDHPRRMMHVDTQGRVLLENGRVPCVLQQIWYSRVLRTVIPSQYPYFVDPIRIEDEHKFRTWEAIKIDTDMDVEDI